MLNSEISKVAVIGLGSIASCHRRNLKKLIPEVCIYTMSASGRIPDQSISNCDYVIDSIEDMLKEHIDAAIVASPTPLHVKHSLPFIEAGIPVLLEKPVAHSISELEKLIDAVSYFGTPLTVGYCLRYMPSAKLMFELLKGNIVGDLQRVFIEVGQYLPDWRPNSDYRQSVSANACLGGGALFELSHELDYAIWFFGELDVKFSILRSSDILKLNVEDSVDVLATTKKGEIVSIHLDFLQRCPSRFCRIIGSEGTLEWNLLQNSILLHRSTSSEIILKEENWDRNEMYINELKNFISLVKNKENDSVSILDGAKVLNLITNIKLKSFPDY